MWLLTRGTSDTDAAELDVAERAVQQPVRPGDLRDQREMMRAYVFLFSA